MIIICLNCIIFVIFRSENYTQTQISLSCKNYLAISFLMICVDIRSKIVDS